GRPAGPTPPEEPAPAPRRCCGPVGWIGLLAEEAGGEVVQGPTPGLPFVGRSGRFEDDVPDAGALEALVHLADVTEEPFLRGPGPEPEEADLRVEGRRVAEGTVVRRPRVEGAN